MHRALEINSRLCFNRIFLQFCSCHLISCYKSSKSEKIDWTFCSIQSSFLRQLHLRKYTKLVSLLNSFIERHKPSSRPTSVIGFFLLFVNNSAVFGLLWCFLQSISNRMFTTLAFCGFHSVVNTLV